MKHLWYSSEQSSLRNRMDQKVLVGKLDNGEKVLYSQMTSSKEEVPNFDDAVYLGTGVFHSFGISYSSGSAHINKSEELSPLLDIDTKKYAGSTLLRLAELSTPKHLWYSPEQSSRRSHMDQSALVGKLESGELVLYSEMTGSQEKKSDFDDAIYLGIGTFHSHNPADAGDRHLPLSNLFDTDDDYWKSRALALLNTCPLRQPRYINRKKFIKKRTI